VRTTIDSYTLTANVENLAYFGTGDFTGTGNDLANVMTGGVGHNILYGLGGDDIFRGGGGTDAFVGGTGNDIYYVDNASDLVVEDANAGIDAVRTTLDSYTLTANVENLAFMGSGNFNGTGNGLSNALFGGAGDDVLHGLGGNDVFHGGGGADTFYGGTGDDIYYVDNSGVVIHEESSEGIDTVVTSLASYSLGANLENLIYTGSGNFTGSGNDLANLLTGGTGNDTLHGLGGDDIVTGGADNDTLYGDGGHDTLDGGTGADVMIGGADDDIYYVDNTGDMTVETPNSGIDFVYTTLNSYTLSDNVERGQFTGSGNFTGTGNASDNDLIGGDGNDILDGGTGADDLIGGNGNDILYVDNLNDYAVGGLGNDTVYTTLDKFIETNGSNVLSIENVAYIGSGNFYFMGLSTDDTVTGGSHDDTIYGREGNDVLYGMDGNDYLDGGGDLISNVDTLYGGAGDDILASSRATDVMTGGSGSDIFLFKFAAPTTIETLPVDIITDFNPAEGDKIDLSQIDAIPYTFGNDAFSFIGNNAFTDQAGQLRYEIDGTTTHLLGDLNGDGIADVKIDLTHFTTPLMEHDLVL
jgi:serralysin